MTNKLKNILSSSTHLGGFTTRWLWILGAFYRNITIGISQKRAFLDLHKNIFPWIISNASLMQNIHLVKGSSIIFSSSSLIIFLSVGQHLLTFNSLAHSCSCLSSFAHSLTLFSFSVNKNWRQENWHDGKITFLFFFFMFLLPPRIYLPKDSFLSSSSYSSIAFLLFHFLVRSEWSVMMENDGENSVDFVKKTMKKLKESLKCAFNCS